MIVLTADIGGTHSRFAAIQVDEGICSLAYPDQWIPTDAVIRFEQLVERLTSGEFAKWLACCTAVAVAVPGPVRDGCASNLPNVRWSVDLVQLRQCFPHVRSDNVYLMNDFVAQAMAHLTPTGLDQICVQPGEVDRTGVIAAVGAGTGFGGCALVPDSDCDYLPVPSEAGHQRFAFCGDDERGFEDFLLRRTDRAEIDINTVVSGYGLASLHCFVTGENLAPHQVAKRLRLETEVSRRFAIYYGRAAQAYALSVLPTGGLYLTGGVAAYAPFLVDSNAFRSAFTASFAHQQLLERVPIYLSRDNRNGLWGAAQFAVRMSRKRRRRLEP